MKTALMLLAPGFEEIEAVTCIDVLRRAEIDVTVVSITKELTVTGSHRIKITADALLEKIKGDADAVILPGGMPGSENLAASSAVTALVKNVHDKGKVVAAICAAPAFVLSAAGILAGREATCYPGLEEHFSAATIYRTEKVVISDATITSQGPGTALPFALAIVEMLAGKARADMLRRSMII